MVGVWFILALLALACVVMAIVWMQTQRRGLSDKEIASLKEVWALTEKLEDPARRIIEADKILHTCLKMHGFTGSLGDALKKAGPRFTDENAVWHAHKLRNRIAHEINHQVSEEEALRAMNAFRRALKDLGMK